jgi:hypothetical protein
MPGIQIDIIEQKIELTLKRAQDIVFNIKDQGPKGDSVELRAFMSFIQWHYIGETTWKNLIALPVFTTGEKITGRDAGIYLSISITDDYLYVCVTGGEAGVAVWKKSLMFQSI